MFAKMQKRQSFKVPGEIPNLGKIMAKFCLKKSFFVVNKKKNNCFPIVENKKKYF